MNIVVVGMGYVGLSNAILLAQHNKVIICDIVKEKVDMLNRKKLPIVDKEMEEYLECKQLDLTAVNDASAAYRGADYIIVATPTNYDAENNYFDTSAVESVIEAVIDSKTSGTMVIKSTIPVGYTAQIKEKYGIDNIIFSPEFLREGKALYDNLYPSRIVIGERSERAERFAGLLAEGAVKKDVPVLYTNSTEAEAIKLFANTYLAMRVAFINELDTYAEQKGLDSRQIIEGISLDPRIGMYYNNPSFGYGGYCLPKDTRQLKADYEGVPQRLISAVVDANTVRKDYIASQILRKNPDIVGIYRLIMKAGSDNFRQSAVFEIIEQLRGQGVKILIYEPGLDAAEYMGIPVEKQFDIFARESDIIVANRMNEELVWVRDKVYTRDLYREN